MLSIYRDNIEDNVATVAPPPRLRRKTSAGKASPCPGDGRVFRGHRLHRNPRCARSLLAGLTKRANAWLCVRPEGTKVAIRDEDRSFSRDTRPIDDEGCTCSRPDPGPVARAA